MNKPRDTHINKTNSRGGKQEAEARAWVVHFASGEVSPEKEDAFAEWLAASHGNREAFERANAIWEGLAEIESIEEILIDQDNVRILSARQSLSRRVLIGGGLAAALACAVGLGLMTFQPAPTETILLATERGDIRTFTLSDGSQITLGGASRLSGTFTARARDLKLVTGNAYFDIARDEDRPLSVNAGQVQVRVLGTRFDIKKRTDWVSVAVDSGQVRVMADDSDDLRDLRSGDKIVSASARQLGALEHFDVEKELSWRTGRLSYVDTPLRDIVADMNQYSGRPIQFVPGAPLDMRLTLSFTVQQIDQVLAGLDAAYPVHVNENDTEILISADP